MSLGLHRLKECELIHVDLVFFLLLKNDYNHILGSWVWVSWGKHPLHKSFQVGLPRLGMWWGKWCVTSKPLHTHSPVDSSSCGCHSHTKRLSQSSGTWSPKEQQDARTTPRLSTIMLIVHSVLPSWLCVCSYFESLSQMDGRGSMRPHNVWTFWRMSTRRACLFQISTCVPCF